MREGSFFFKGGDAPGHQMRRGDLFGIFDLEDNDLDSGRTGNLHFHILSMMKRVKTLEH